MPTVSLVSFWHAQSIEPARASVTLEAHVLWSRNSGTGTPEPVWVAQHSTSTKSQVLPKFPDVSGSGANE